VAAAGCGADAIGLVFAKSRRGINPAEAKSIVRALEGKVMTVGVFVNEKPQKVRAVADETGLDAVQLHGAETPAVCGSIGCKVIKRFSVGPEDTARILESRMKAYSVFGYLLDPGAGDGVPFDWKAAAGIPLPLIVAGGLNSANVGFAVKMLRPFGVDVSSGVEKEPGVKDVNKIRHFIEEVIDAENHG
jgi:phosphoribosylanthranilate isomerase